MLVSKSNKIVFVHIQKTGGSSVREILRAQLGDSEEVGFKHDWACWHYKEIPGWDECFKFAFVRNPWDRLVSWYSMIVQNKVLLNQSRNRLWEYVIREANTFDEFIRNCTLEIDDFDGRKGFLYNQLDYLTDNDGNLLVDFIGKYETFEDSMQYVMRSLRLTGDAVFTHENRSKHKHYSSYYTEDLKNIVAERYAKDIKYFGYTFESESGDGVLR